MRKRYLIRAAAVVAITVLIVLGVLARVVYQRTRPWVRITAAQVENDIRDHLPIGSSRAEVAAYLDNKGISHSYISKDSYLKDGNYEIAIIRDTAHSSLTRTDIQMYFNFDSKLRLVSYYVQAIGTGP